MSELTQHVHCYCSFFKSSPKPVFPSFLRFGEESMSRVLRWMDKTMIPENAAILDIGTGNGAFLVEMV